MIAHHDEQRRVVKALDNMMEDAVHLAELGSHGGAGGPQRVAHVVHTKKVRHEDAPVALRELFLEMLLDCVVNGVEIPHIERWGSNRPHKA